VRTAVGTTWLGEAVAGRLAWEIAAADAVAAEA
jgi:hypothetical protein